MNRYQIKILDGDLSDLIHDLAMRATKRAEGAAHERAGRREAYLDVFESVKAVLRKYVRGFHCPQCNRGDEMCEIGVCTEFDPWAGVAPREAGKVPGHAA